MDLTTLEISEIGLSNRSRNGLYRAGLRTASELLPYNEDMLYQIPALGKKSVDEILDKITELKALQETEELSLEGSFLKFRDLRIDDLPLLSTKAYNALLFAGYERLEQVAFLTEEQLLQIPHMDQVCAEEIYSRCRQFLAEHRNEIDQFAEQQKETEKNELPASAKELLQIPAYHDAILEYVRANDIAVEETPLTPGKIRSLQKDGRNYLSDIIFFSDHDFLQVPGFGAGAVQKARDLITDYLRDHGSGMLAYCSGDSSALWDDRVIEKKLLGLYAEKEFGGFSLAEFMNALGLPESYGEDRLKTLIGKLLANGSLEYVDFRCYRLYDRFEDYLQEYDGLDDREREFIRRKLDGETLEAIAQDHNLTRERVRQVIKSNVSKMRLAHKQQTGQACFDEEYYVYLYENYAFDKKAITDSLGITPSVWRFLALVCEKQGNKDLQDAQDDPQLEAGLRFRIRNFLNRKKVFIDGVWVNKTRSALEDVAARKLCQDEVSFKDFPQLYNGFLLSEGVGEDEDLFCTQEVLLTRKNRLTDSRSILWKTGGMFRYYDIDARDYTELLDTLDFDSYENIEFSTAKFFRDYPDIMKKYDIRDHYELHNLLRKIVPDGSYHDFKCGRMPNIQFGSFDRDAMVRDMMFTYAPISMDDLAQKIYDEYGYDPKTTKGTYLNAISRYYHQGMYTIDQKSMPEENIRILESSLTENFYYLPEVRKLYTELLPGADPDEVNKSSLMEMGFKVYSGYIMRNHPSVEQYFTGLLTGPDIVDLKELRRRYGGTGTFYNKVNELRNDLQLIEFESGKAIQIRKLECSGHSREQFYAFCDAVYNFVEDGSYFTIESIRKDGFSSDLFDLLGFDNWFYANLLISDDRLSFNNMFGNLVFYKGKKDITIKSFLLDRVNEHRKVDILDLMTELDERYGCTVKNRFDILEKIKETPVYHDKIQDHLYADEDLYYQDMDAI